MNTSLGRHVYGLAAIALGISALIFQSFHIWQIEGPKIPHPEILIDFIAIVQIGGGLAIQFQRSARAGATVLGILFGVCALFWLSQWIQKPLVYDRLGNVFEQFSMVCGALIIYGPKTARIGYCGFGVSLISFAIVQAEHLGPTAGLVPKWIPPGQMFWALATTVAFVLAAIALLTGRSALLAARLTTLMLVIFGLVIWVPLTFAYPHSLVNWAELIETFGICGAAWIVADYLARRRTPIVTSGTAQDHAASPRR